MIHSMITTNKKGWFGHTIPYTFDNSSLSSELSLAIPFYLNTEFHSANGLNWEYTNNNFLFDFRQY